MLENRISPDLIEGRDPRRREPRVEIWADISIRQLGAQGAEARLINLSSLGFMAETDAPIAAGARVWLSLPGLCRINALVVWTRGVRLGGEFATPIDPLLVFQAAGEGMRPTFA